MFRFLDVINKITVHDQEMSPVVHQIKDAIDNDEINDITKDDDYSDDLHDTDKTKHRKKDKGKGKKEQKKVRKKANKGIKAYLPISDKRTNAHISKYGGLTLNEKNKSWNIRITDDDHLKDLRDGTWQQQTDEDPGDEDDSEWRHLLKADYHDYDSDWINKEGHQSYYTQSDWYLGQLVFANSGLITTTAPTFTLRANISDDDYIPDYSNDDGMGFKKNKNGGTLRRVWHKDKKDPTINTIDDASPEQPGELAGLQVGRIRVNNVILPAGKKDKYGKRHADYRQGDVLCDRIAYKTKYVYSELSLKKNVKPLSKSKALNTLLNTDIAEYQYKGDKHHEKHASVIIDDVHDKPQWKTPKAFIADNGAGGGRKDDVTVGYLVKAVQALQDQINDLKDENKDLKKQLNDLKG